MKRRAFLKSSATAILATGFHPGLLTAASCCGGTDRLAMTTVTFMNRFVQTRPKDASVDAPLLTLMDIPEYFAGRFGLKNLEFWSRHFESTEAGYLEALRDRIAQQGTRLVNIQLDGRYDLSDPDEAARAKSIELAKQWIQAAEAVGSQGLRLNPGGHSVDLSIESFKRLADVAAERGITLYVENHMGFGTDPAAIIRIHQSVNSSSLKVLTDFANFRKDIDQLEGIRMLIPRTGLISAKAFYFDEDGRHPDYDFDACVRAAEAAGYTGVYSAEYYDPKKRPADPEYIADQILTRIRSALA